MTARKRAGFSLISLLVILAIIAILLGLLLPAVQKARQAAQRVKSLNNMKQIALGFHNYHDAQGSFPPGVDANHFSALVRLLPYLEQQALFQQIDLAKPLDQAPEQVRMTRVPMFISDRDPLPAPTKFGATNYLFVAGSKPELKDNDGVFYLQSATKIADILDGTSNTIAVVEDLHGDGGKQAVDVHRQHVKLKANDLAGLNADSGVKEWENGKSIAGDRGASWMDGRFLQGTFTATRAANDSKPDVNCGGEGGLSGVRSLENNCNVGFMDGSVRAVKTELDLATWKALATRKGGEVIPAGF